MRVFDYGKLKSLQFDSRVINLLTSIHEAKGRQELYLRQKPEELNRLVEIAKVQSIDASNAIEGIRTTDSRLRQLVSEKTTPKNRDEEEISGYRDALNIIHESFDYIPISTNYILQLHGILFRHVENNNFGGTFKNSQNYIQGINAQGEPFVVFTPLAPFETAPAIENLCDTFNKALEEGIVDPLILIPVFIHDFLCIHPFRDGNGRMSRLLTTLLLYRSGYYVGKYVSLEAKIARIKDLYYDALGESRQDGMKARMIRLHSLNTFFQLSIWPTRILRNVWSWSRRRLMPMTLSPWPSRRRLERYGSLTSSNFVRVYLSVPLRRELHVCFRTVESRSTERERTHSMSESESFC